MRFLLEEVQSYVLPDNNRGYHLNMGTPNAGESVPITVEFTCDISDLSTNVEY